MELTGKRIFEVGETAARIYCNEGYDAAVRYSESLTDVYERCISTVAIGACQTAMDSEIAKHKQRLNDAIARCIEIPSDNSVYLESGVRG